MKDKVTGEQTLAITKQDQVFLQQFEQLSLPAEQFNHLGHLRIAWIYLLINQQSTQAETKAVKQVCVGIKAYAESLGAAMKFHKTITTALVIITAKRMAALMQTLNKTQLTCDDWRLFVKKNTDLVNDAVGVLKTYYSEPRLYSDEAKLAWCEPDIKEI